MVKVKTLLFFILSYFSCAFMTMACENKQKTFVKFPPKETLEKDFLANGYRVFITTTDILNITKAKLTPRDVCKKVETAYSDFLKNCKKNTPVVPEDSDDRSKDKLQRRILEIVTILLQADLAARKQLMVDGLYPSTLVKLPSKEALQEALAKQNMKFFMQHTDILTITDEQLTPDEVYQRVDATVTDFFKKWKDGFSVMEDESDSALTGRMYCRKQDILKILLQNDPEASRELWRKNLYGDPDSVRYGCRY